MAGIPKRKVIPVLRDGDHQVGRNCAIPTHLSGIYAVDVRSKRLQSGAVEQLLRAIFNTPPVKRRSGAPSALLRLPTMKDDGWLVRSGVKTNKKHPKTFWIPAEKQRSNLKVEDLAKLVFEIEDRYDGEVCGERMWVRITGKVGPYYVGALGNQPLTRHRYLKWGCSIVFLPEHVIDIVPLAKRAAHLKGKY